MKIVYEVTIEGSEIHHHLKESNEDLSENIKDCILDGMGYPLIFDNSEEGRITVIVKERIDD